MKLFFFELCRKRLIWSETNNVPLITWRVLMVCSSLLYDCIQIYYRTRLSEIRLRILYWPPRFWYRMLFSASFRMNKAENVFLKPFWEIRWTLQRVYTIFQNPICLFPSAWPNLPFPPTLKVFLCSVKVSVRDCCDFPFSFVYFCVFSYQ